MQNILSGLVLLLTLVVTTATAFASEADPATVYGRALDSWGALLEAHVDDEGRIDFEAIAANPERLRDYITAIESYGPASHPEDFATRTAVLAYHANTYNALAMWGVIERGIPDGFTSFFQRAAFFKFRPVRIAGQKTNLHDYENKVIRPLNEPRMHFALNCMVRDCPRLPRQAFLAAELHRQLDRAAIEFFSHPRKLQIDHDAREIRVSAILDFYTRDFVASGRAEDLPSYINRYLEQPLPENYQIKFLKYDWRVNRQPISKRQLPTEG